MDRRFIFSFDGNFMCLCMFLIEASYVEPDGVDDLDELGSYLQIFLLLVIFRFFVNCTQFKYLFYISDDEDDEGIHITT